MEIRRARPSDLASIARIQAASREAAQWDPADYFKYDCFVAVEDAVTGFLVSRLLDVDEREILNIAVDPARRGRGTGAALVRHELAMGARVWFLEVRESNAPARGLYRNAGFEDAGVRPAYYDDPVEGAIVMRIFS